MPRRKPTQAQAQLHLQVYDLRREARLRKAREWTMQNFFVEDLEDYSRIAPPGSEEGTYAMMVVSYWDQACALLNFGLLHEELFFETSAEFYVVWDRVKPIVPVMREKYHIRHWVANLEKAASRFEKWVERKSPGALDAMRELTKIMREANARKTIDTAAASAN